MERQSSLSNLKVNDEKIEGLRAKMFRRILIRVAINSPLTSDLELFLKILTAAAQLRAEDVEVGNTLNVHCIDWICINLGLFHAKPES